MSLVIETFVSCDSGISPSCEENFGIDNRQRTGKQQREAMVKNGWVHHCHADYCPRCFAVLKNTNQIRIKP
jgi:hypothetical protein